LLLIGNNGSGKSTVARSLEILQRIAQGTNRVCELVKPVDFSLARENIPMRFEIEVTLKQNEFRYTPFFQIRRFPRRSLAMAGSKASAVMVWLSVDWMFSAGVWLKRKTADRIALY
jgi:ABC-type glutathione transport system ATPase component